MRGLLTCLAVLIAAAPAAAGSFTVQVGYADDLRPSPFFPSPWIGGAGVDLFAGNTSNFDAGAVRVINTGATPIVIQALTVDSFANGASFTLWNTFLPFTLDPGKSAIFTQTSASENFDTSDQPQHDLPADSATPHVKVTIDGVLSDLVDTAQVLNTEGSDHLALNNLNESHAWRDIGTFGGQAAPEPGSIVLLSMGVASMAGYSWRRKKKAVA